MHCYRKTRMATSTPNLPKSWPSVKTIYFQNRTSLCNNRSIARSQELRIICICSTVTDAKKHLKAFENVLVNKKYQRDDFIQKIEKAGQKKNSGKIVTDRILNKFYISLFFTTKFFQTLAHFSNQSGIQKDISRVTNQSLL